MQLTKRNDVATMDDPVKSILNQLRNYFGAVNNAFDGVTYEEKAKGIQYLREECRTKKEEAQLALRQCIWSDDGAIRILAAEALSLSRSYPKDSIPVLIATLQVGYERRQYEKDELWIGLALGALTNYGPLAIEAQVSVWPFLYAPTTEALQKMATRFVLRIAKTSDSAWTIACLLCHHENQVIRDLAKSIMNSEEFKGWD